MSFRWRPATRPSREMTSSELYMVMLPGRSSCSLRPMTQLTRVRRTISHSSSVSAEGMRTLSRCMAAVSSVSRRTETAPRQ